MTSRLHHLNIRGQQLMIDDVEGSKAAYWVASELNADEYGLRHIDFQPGDVVIDIGAHVGLFAIYLAALHPEITVFAFEPDPRNFQHLAANIARGKAMNVFAFNLAVTADGRAFEMHRPPENSGGAGGYYRQTEGYGASIAASVTLDQIMTRFAPNGCKLLKMDCEGAEHEILPASQSLAQVGWFSAEFHINDALRDQGCSNEGLRALVARVIPPARTAVKSITMGR